MIRIMLVDDHQIVRQGLKALLESEAGWSVVGEAEDGPAAVDLVVRLKPDVLVVDLALPGTNGLDIIRRAHALSPQTRIVVLTMYAGEAYVLESLRAGALAYVLKEAGIEELVDAIRAALDNRRYLSQPISQLAIDAYMQRAGRTLDATAWELTDREREVLALTAEGRSAGEIATLLGISARTVETHRYNLMKKLGIHSQAEVVQLARQHGLS